MEILIADDHELYRQAIRQLILDINQSSNIIEANSHESALELLTKYPSLDLVLYDLSMPGIKGIKAVELILIKYPTTPIAVLSGSENPFEIQTVMNLGAMGFIPKSSSNNTIKAAIEVILSGNYFKPNIPSLGPIDKLTSRQLEILHKLKEGKSNKTIGTELSISDTTVKTHLHTIFKILEVNNRTQAANMINKLELST